jgi:SAM-dependent methyltransferase
VPRNYDELVEIHGDSPLGLGWGPKDRRELRFKVLIEPWDLRNASILDIGCGFGDFHGHLEAQGIEVDYTGMDTSVKVLEIARSKNPTGHFELFDVANLKSEKRSFDYIFASGIFNDKRYDSMHFVTSTIEEVNRLARFGFSFNFLSATAKHRYEESEYIQPSAIARICENNYLRFQINHFYMPFEFTLHVSKTDDFNPDTVTFDDYFDIVH